MCKTYCKITRPSSRFCCLCSHTEFKIFVNFRNIDCLYKSSFTDYFTHFTINVNVLKYFLSCTEEDLRITIKSNLMQR